MSYAQNTSVSIERSQEHIKETLRRYEADRFGIMEERDQALVEFTVRGLTVQMTVPMPDRHSTEFTRTPTGKDRAPNQAYQAYQQACRQRWRALLLAIKAKLEAVDAGISSIETEFMPFILMGDGRTVGQHLLPRLREAADNGQMPTSRMLPAPSDSA